MEWHLGSIQLVLKLSDLNHTLKTFTYIHRLYGELNSYTVSEVSGYT